MSGPDERRMEGVIKKVNTVKHILDAEDTSCVACVTDPRNRCEELGNLVAVGVREKELSSQMFKRTFRIPPAGVWWWHHPGVLAGILRTGRARTNTAADLTTVLA